ncbi:D-methionine transport system substrate-binding protein [Actinoplanes lutulentus]|uniref:D-methionine transport system substrate-binding protein n=1 Tax=Actinoplanes lutulentus TaxID=1287878 RepID=A0A327Z3V5_9ACTN|nr:MetQ/NlpA family ABC transporter substrate-binding protein [Actinoplanes lutulentus]MBB2946912.1 D-methionine transport system substrate-binding protein [Actinoplanes lutulentus]RAK30415.1 D-methionine transport system substrate-binding protein [Actinoplanes lutulentus]
MRRIRMIAVLAASVIGLAACGSTAEVSYNRPDEGTLLIYTGAGAFRDVLRYTVDNLLPPTTKVQLVDAPADANERIEAGDADLAFYQQAPAFEQGKASYPSLSVVSKVSVEPYALYSAKWTDLKETPSWVNMGVVEDEVTGQSLPHGSKIVLPGSTENFARGLYLLQSAHLVELDRPFGGVTPVDLSITEANVKDSLRHLSLLGLHSDERLTEIYPQYDALVLSPRQAAILGLDPKKDALAVEPGPKNPWATVLVAPSRLAGDPRLLELTHALESPSVATFLTSGPNLPATP